VVSSLPQIKIAVTENKIVIFARLLVLRDQNAGSPHSQSPERHPLPYALIRRPHNDVSGVGN
jgi:hypothetical protein